MPAGFGWQRAFPPWQRQGSVDTYPRDPQTLPRYRSWGCSPRVRSWPLSNFDPNGPLSITILQATLRSRRRWILQPHRSEVGSPDFFDWFCLKSHSTPPSNGSFQKIPTAFQQHLPLCRVQAARRRYVTLFGPATDGHSRAQILGPQPQWQKHAIWMSKVATAPQQLSGGSNEKRLCSILGPKKSSWNAVTPMHKDVFSMLSMTAAVFYPGLFLRITMTTMVKKTSPKHMKLGGEESLRANSSFVLGTMASLKAAGWQNWAQTSPHIIS